jgi:hypothetical protein
MYISDGPLVHDSPPPTVAMSYMLVPLGDIAKGDDKHERETYSS